MFGFKGHNEPIHSELDIFIFQPRLWHFRMLIQRCTDQLNGFLLLSYLASSQGCSTTTVWPSPLIVFSGWGGWQNLMLMWAMWAACVLVTAGSCQASWKLEGSSCHFGSSAVGPGTFIAPILRSKQRLNSFRMKGAKNTFFIFSFFLVCSIFSGLVFSGKFHVGTCVSVFARRRDWHFHLGGSAMQYDQKSKSLYVTWHFFLAKKRRSFFNNETKWRQRKSEKKGYFFW